MSSTAVSSRPMEVFISYAHEDERLMQRLDAELASLKIDGLIRVWSDGEILPGAKWHQEILDHLRSADIVLLLISGDFLNSPFAIHEELEEAMERHGRGETVVIPVISRHCRWKSEAIGTLEHQAVPKNGLPIDDDGHIRDSRLLEVVEAVERVARHLSGCGDRDGRPSAEDRAPKLAFLCDRTRQELELELRLTEHIKNKMQRPFVCLVHGDAWEQHDAFLERLRVSSLRRILSLDSEVSPGSVYRLRWPFEYGSRRVVHDLIRSDLSLAFGTSREALGRVVAQHEPGVIVYSEVHSQEWRNSGPKVIKAFLDFWNQWPDNLPEKRFLVVCLFLKFERAPEAADGSRWLYPDPVDSIRQFLAGLKLSRSKGMGGVILPELAPIEAQDVISWGVSAPVNRTYAIRENRGEFEKQVYALYKTKNKDAMALEELWPSLKLIVFKYWRAGK